MFGDYTVNTEIDRFPVSDLPNRYSIGRTVLYERLGILAIAIAKPIRTLYFG
jgi:hypothetical protein